MDNQNKKPLSLYAMWLEAHNRNALPAEWKLAHNFLTWATKNGYKTEYGYEGEFTPDNLRAAILKNPNADVKATVADAFGLPEKIVAAVPAELAGMIVGVDLASGPDKTVISHTKSADDLVKTKKLDELKKLAADMAIDLGKATKKEDIAKLIVAAGEVNADAGE